MAVQTLINIDVDDLGKATTFYCDAFGLRVGRRFGAEVVELLGAEAAIYLLAKAAGSQATAGGDGKRTYARHWTPIHLDFVVADVEAAVARAETAGASREGAIESHAWGRIATLADPFGHGFCLLEFRGRGYDEIADA